MADTTIDGGTSADAGDLSSLGMARLMTLALQGVRLKPIAAQLLSHAASHPDDSSVLMSLSVALQLQGLRTEGLAVQACALRSQRLYSGPILPEPRLRLLALMAPGDLMTNAPLEFLIQQSDVAMSCLYLMPDEPLPSCLPAHDVLFIAVSESERTRDLLQRIGAKCSEWDTPVINRAERILLTGRTRACAALRDLSGVVMPDSARMTRLELSDLSLGVAALSKMFPETDFPIIARPVDSHAGKHLVRLDTACQVREYLASVDSSDFIISPFFDYRSSDGFYRKFRVVLIDGTAYPAHMGISSNWMIHYLNAGMAESAAKRAEEQYFMDHFDVDFGQRHQSALRAIGERLGLEYLVLDCAETADGKLLIFEVDPGAVVHSMDSHEIFPYKRPQMDRIFNAFRQLLGRFSRQAPSLAKAS